MKTIIIAEAGVNHNGSLELAKKLVDEAKKSGADFVKFQTFKDGKFVISKIAQKADYQKVTTGEGESQLEMVNKLKLSFDDFRFLKQYCVNIGIEFLSTPFDLESIDFLHELGMKVWKIPSGEITNLPYLLKIAAFHEPIILSTGMSNLDEVKTSVKILQENGAGKITLLHCTTEYPTPIEDVNLLAMKTMAAELNLPVGYSDHTQGIEISLAAVAMGAVVIEKHFTLDRNMEGPDHKASLEPSELKELVLSVRNIEKAMGDGIKIPSASEIKNINIARKSIVAKTDIKKGEKFTEDNITIKRPGNGISPMKWFEVLGQKSVRDFKEDELIKL